MQLAISAYKHLKPIERKLHRLSEDYCNGIIDTQEYDTKCAKLLKEAQVAANWTGLKIYHQTDPRGCALYLIDDSMGETTYSNGIAIC